MKLKSSRPEIVLRNGKPSAVILDIEAYEDLLERFEQQEDLKALAAIRKKSIKFRPLKDFLAEFRSHV